MSTASNWIFLAFRSTSELHFEVSQRPMRNAEFSPNLCGGYVLLVLSESEQQGKPLLLGARVPSTIALC